MSLLTRFKFFLWTFGHFKVAMIGYTQPKLLKLDDKEIIVRLPLNRHTKNHLNSMYFGALAVGADIAGGFHGFYHADKAQCKVSLVFKSFQAQFIVRPESAVFFVSQDGMKVANMITESQKSGERINQLIQIKAYTHYDTNPQEVANFQLELSIKVILNKGAGSVPDRPH